MPKLPNLAQLSEPLSRLPVQHHITIYGDWSLLKAKIGNDKASASATMILWIEAESNAFRSCMPVFSESFANYRTSLAASLLAGSSLGFPQSALFPKIKQSAKLRLPGQIVVTNAIRAQGVKELFGPLGVDVRVDAKIAAQLDAPYATIYQALHLTKYGDYPPYTRPIAPELVKPIFAAAAAAAI